MSQSMAAISVFLVNDVFISKSLIAHCLINHGSVFFYVPVDAMLGYGLGLHVLLISY